MADSGEHPTLGGRSHAPQLPLPYFEAWRGDGPATRARLLLVSPLFPPSTEVGALRWQKFSDRFASHGWKLDVLAYEPTTLDDVDAQRLEDLPVGTRSYGVGAPELGVDRVEREVRELLRPLRKAVASWRLRGKRSSGAAGVHRPDGGRGNRSEWMSPEQIRGESPSPRGLYRAYRAWRHVRQASTWAERAVAVGTSLALTVDYRAVVSCGPPHRAHVAAREIARRIDRPLVLDFRDPWSLIETLPEDRASPLWLRHIELAERECVGDARLIVTCSEPHREAIAERYPGAADRTVTVLNGFDPDVGCVATKTSDRFLVVYTGSVYGTRDPRPFLRAAGDVVRQLDLSPEEFGIEFIGKVGHFGGRPLGSLAAEQGLADHFDATGLLPREEALRRAARASLLLNLPQEWQLCIPAKLYEYLQMQGRILALEHPGSATERLLRGRDADVVRPDDVEGIARVIRERYAEHAAGERSWSKPPDPELSRASQAERFLRALEGRLP